MPYVPRALALHKSLLRHNARAQFAYFCVDDLSASLLESLDLPRAFVLREADFAGETLKQLKASRSTPEYCWTCKPFALEHLARTLPEADWLVYLDSDMMLFGDPDGALPQTNVHYLLTPHRPVPEFAQYAESTGIFNAGYLAVRPSAEGLGVLQWWRERCVERCSSVPIPHSYADQKYLDRLPDLFPFGELRPGEGLNAAPWNIGGYRLGGSGGKIRLNDSELVLYHFQGLRLLSSRLADLYAGHWRIPRDIRDWIYRPYLDSLREAYAALEASSPGRAPRIVPALRSIRAWLRLMRGMASGRHNLVGYRMTP